MTQITPNIQRELNSHRLLKRVLDGQQLTVIYDLDETFLTRGGEGFTTMEVNKASTEQGAYGYWKYVLEHSYPKSLMQFELINSLRQLNQGIGVATTSDVNALLELKLAGIDLNDLDFVIFQRMEGFEDPRLLNIHKEVLGVNNPDVKDLTTYIEAISAKYKVSIEMMRTRYEKRRALNSLCENDSRMQDLFLRKLISIGDQEQDGYLALPFNDKEEDFPYWQSEPELFRPVEGGLGLMIPGNTPKNHSSPYGDEYVSSLGPATAYAAAVVTKNPEASGFVEQVQQRYLLDYALERQGKPVGSVHWINPFSGQDAGAAESTWSEIENGGPLMNKIRGLFV